jgi:SAM-dependent methyltransferase
VAPGEVIGVDREAHRFPAVRALAAERGLTNLRFEAGDLYALPYPDASFDAVFICHVLQHVAAPLDVLRELRRVLRPGGVIGVRDPDEGATLMAPLTAALERLRGLEMRLRHHHGGDPFYARHQRRLLLAAGFVDAEAGVAAAGGGSATLTREVTAGLRARLAGPSGADAIVALGWATRAEMDAMLAELAAWGERPDAFYAGMLCHALAWAPR